MERREFDTDCLFFSLEESVNSLAWLYYSIVLHHCLFKQAAVKKKIFFFLVAPCVYKESCFLILIHKKG